MSALASVAAWIPVTLLALAAMLVLLNHFLKLRLETRAQHFANRDPLTGLPARPLLYDRLDQAIAQADRAGHCVAVLFVDLDRFKAVNDTFGHGVGDRVLCEASERLLELAGDDATVARISSDEFVIVLPDRARTEEAAIFAGRVLTLMQRPFQLDGPVYCTASIGIAVHAGDGTTAAALIRNADIAMCRAKQRGRNNFQFFLPEMHRAAARRLQLEMALREALPRGEFMVQYQPRVDVRSGSITGFEALLRWRHPEMGVLAPAEFIPVLEDTDLIIPVGEWVLRTVCRQIAQWQAQGLAAHPVGVNLSMRQFRLLDIDKAVARVIEEEGVPASLVELELTESLLMDDPERAAGALDNLRRFGVRLAVDDFGTGYSSLAYLKRFPIGALKIDRAFISDVAHNAEDAAIARAMINLGHILGLKVVAEGVETPAQLEFLRAHGCDEMQGFLFSGALCAREIDALLAAQSPAAISPRIQATN
ncbi:MAG TPA: EAL domain-containing protein [Usitatibacter sp.]|nr:EAL domain-containing protein [Usitatibacter sp.]